MSALVEILGRWAWTQSWQLAVLILLAVVASKLFSDRWPHATFMLWLVVLLKCVTPPVISSPLGVFSWAQSRPAATTSDTGSPRVRQGALAELAVGPAETPAAETQLPDIVVHWRKGTDDDSLSQRAGKSKATDLFWVGCWLGGAALGLVWASGRWWAYNRRLRLAAGYCPRSWQTALDALATRLRVRRPVRLWISESRSGPAVIGLWRPTIILPAALIRDRGPKQFEAILAHELLHVRRGDLWCGVWQLLAACLWWFHPFVWWAMRWINRNAERCCDEEVLAELGCPPADYARSLLEVLQCKQQLRAAPMFPGVRPVDVTQKRLEQIMDDRQGRPMGAPWWCWVLLAAAAMVLLPGAARVLNPGSNAPVYSAPQQAMPIPPIPTATLSTPNDPAPIAPLTPWPQSTGLNPSPNAQIVSQPLYPQQATIAPIATDPVPPQVRDVEDLVQQIVQGQGGSRESAEQFLTHLLRAMIGVTAAEPNSNASTLVVLTATQDGESAKSRVAAMLNPQQLKSLDAALTRLRKHGFQQVQISARWISLPAKMLNTQAFSVNWRAEAESDTQFPPKSSFPGEPTPSDDASPWTRRGPPDKAIIG